MRGSVKWFDSKKGYGFITPELDQMGHQPADVFVHFSEIMGQPKGKRNLMDGDVVDFEVGAGAKGPCAKNVRLAATTLA